MSNPTEMEIRVAKALFPGNDDDWKAANHQTRAAFLRKARAAIRAMYEPTDVMIQKGVETDDNMVSENTDMETVVTAFAKSLPPHEGELSLTHNPHKSNYETVEEWARDDYPGAVAWVSDAEREAAIKANDVWVLHWYPNTPVGFNVLCAYNLAALIRASAE